jgi:hypothetical protein
MGAGAEIRSIGHCRFEQLALISLVLNCADAVHLMTNSSRRMNYIWLPAHHQTQDDFSKVLALIPSHSFFSYNPRRNLTEHYIYRMSLRIETFSADMKYTLIYCKVN